MLTRTWRGARRVLCGGLVLAVLGLYAPAGRAALPDYQLYYAFQIPLAKPTIEIASSGSATSYGGTIAGTLGGLTLKSGSFEYGGQTGGQLGGGWFTLVTDAGAVTHPEILETNDGQRTTVLFFGTYLGIHIEFRLSVVGYALGSPGESDTGLADTGFASQEQYLAAVEAGVASLPPATRQQLIAAATTNTLLVSEYQQKTR